LSGILIAAVQMTVSNLFAYCARFIASGSSALALIYAVKPIYQVLLIIPFGLLAGKEITFWKKINERMLCLKYFLMK
jgi:hypothetical protein